MGFGESIALVLAFGGTLASILGVFYTIASRRNGRETRALINETQALIKGSSEDTRALIKGTSDETRALIRETQEETRALIKAIQEDIKIMHQQTQTLIERIDRRADERHSEAIEAIRALKSA